MTRVLTLPGWQGSSPEHWQSRWERLRGCERVEQRDWMRPRVAEWVDGLEATVARAREPVIVAAHSLGCALVAHWASKTTRASRVSGALLVAPPDVERESAPAEVRGFAPIPMQRLPFATLLVASTSDPYCGFMRAALMATYWGAEFVNVGNAGHINAESDLGDWDAGWRLLEQLRRTTRIDAPLRE